MDLHGKVWTRWRSVPPPRQTIVFGYYEDDREPRRGRTCRHGCCWNCGAGQMMPPAWWAPCDDQTSPLPFESIGDPEYSPTDSDDTPQRGRP